MNLNLMSVVWTTFAVGVCLGFGLGLLLAVYV